MNEAKNIFITGAAGFLGSSLVRSSFNSGATVFSLTRSAKSAPHHLHFDLYEPELTTSLRPDVFIHAAYVKQEKGINAFEVNLQAAKVILKFCSANNTFPLFISSLTAEENALSVYGRQKFAIEKLFLDAGGAVIRPGLILGNGGLFASMRDYLKVKQRIPLFGDGKQPLQTVHIDDLVKGINTVVEKKLKGTFTICEETPVTYREFYQGLCDSMGVKPKFTRTGFRSAYFALWMMNLFGMKAPVAKDNLLGLQQMKKMNPEKDLEQLGLKLRNWKESLRSLPA